MDKLFMGWGFSVLEFSFVLFFFSCQVWLQQGSTLFGLPKVSQACLELVAGVLVDGWWQAIGQQVGRLASCGPWA
jgi:hypothetical protein